MDSVSIATASCATKATKRIPERDSDLDDDANKASAHDLECNHVKRFRGTIDTYENIEEKAGALDKNCFESPKNLAALPKAPNKLILSKSCQRFNENLVLAALSPITEISINMLETSLNTPNEKAAEISTNTGAYLVDYDTPLKSWAKVKRSGTHKFNHFTRMLQRKAECDADTTTETILGVKQHEDDKSNDDTDNSLDSGFQIPSSATSQRSICGVRRLNMDSATAATASNSLHDEMAIDELSFYDDEENPQPQQSSFNACPQLMGLLSPEGSPQRFHIVERTAAGDKASKFLQPLGTRQQKHAQNSTISSNTTPAKNFRLFHSLSSGSMESTSMDDEYMELFEMESLESQSQLSLNFPSNLNSLISGHIKHSKSPAINNNNNNNSLLLKTPEMRRPSVRRCLSMTENHQQLQQQQPKTPELLLKQMQESAANSLYAPCCFKRPEPPTSATCSPVLSKRYRSAEEKENLNGSYSSMTNTNSPISVAATTACPRQTLRKSMSMNDAEILSALARSDSTDQPDLIGDFSKPFVLPLMDGRHRDLKSVSSDTVARLLNGEFDEQIASYKIIDCRYPYEFEGGHIRGAMNLYTQEQIIEEFLNQQKTEQQTACSTTTGHKRNIIIFHCEFSSERGPKLSRFLRNNDRARNTNLYPALDYPEIYLLHNGYKEFYETHAALCDPIAYRPMLEPSFSEAYRHFRAKSKSWNGDGLGGATSRLKKSRSRLLL